MLYARAAPVRGRLLAFGSLLFASIDLRPGSEPLGNSESAGIAAFDRETGEELWRRLGLPPLIARDDQCLYAYGRAGLVVALGFDGEQRWRSEVPDDRSPLSRERGDRDGPVPADVVPIAPGVVVAACDELLLLGRRDGGLLRRIGVSWSPRGMVARLARTGESLVCTCTARSAADDDPAATQRRLWGASWTLESLRTAGGDIVALDLELGERWRIPPPEPRLVWGERRPVASSSGRIFAVAATSTGTALSTLEDRLVAVEPDDGAVAFVRPMVGGRGRFDPIAVGDGIVAGSEAVLYSPGGEPRWRLPDALQLDVSVAPTLADGRLIVVGGGRLLAVEVASGETTPLAAFASRLPFAGSVTTELCVADGVAYLGAAERGRPTELRALPIDGSPPP